MIRQAGRSRDKYTDKQRYHPFPVPRDCWMVKRRPGKEKGLAQKHTDLEHGPPAPSSRLCPQRPTREGKERKKGRLWKE